MLGREQDFLLRLLFESGTVANEKTRRAIYFRDHYVAANLTRWSVLQWSYVKSFLITYISTASTVRGFERYWGGVLSQGPEK